MNLLDKVLGSSIYVRCEEKEEAKDLLSYLSKKGVKICKDRLLI